MAASALQLTEGDTRGCRLYHLIVQGGGLVLRYNIRKKCPNLTIFLNDPGVKLEIDKLKIKHSINESEYEKLYPTSGASSSENYDISLLVVLHRTFFCVKPSNDPIWFASNIPATTDHSDEAEIVRLRNFRNEIHHRAKVGGITMKVFDTLWNEISQVLLRFGAGIPNLKTELEKLKTTFLDKEFEKVLLAKLQEWFDQDKAMEEVVVKTILRHSPSEMALERSRRELADVLDEEYFVKTEIFKQAENMFEKEGFIVLKGAQGEGKTTLSKKLVKNPDKCLKVNKPTDWDLCNDDDVETVLIDDMFGCAMFDKGESRKWLKNVPGMIDKVSKNHLKLIITSRSYILDEVLDKMFVSHLISDKNTLEISSKDLKDHEKKQILESHMKLNERDIDNELVSDCIEQSNNPSSFIIGFPECARLFCKQENLFQRKGDFFSSPMTHIKTCLVSVFETKHTFLAFFVLWAQKSQKLRLRDLEQTIDNTPVSILGPINQLGYNPFDSLRTIHETLANNKDFIHNDTKHESFWFNHRVLSDAVGLVAFEKNKTAVLKYCDAPFIERYICIEGQGESTDDDPNDVKVMVICNRYDQLFSKIGQLICPGNDMAKSAADTNAGEGRQMISDEYLNCTILLHPAFQDDEFCKGFINSMTEEQMLLTLLTKPVSTVGASLLNIKNVLDEGIFKTEIGVLAYAVKHSVMPFALACFSEMERLRGQNENVKMRLETDLKMSMLLATECGDISKIRDLISKMKVSTDDCNLIFAAITKAHGDVLALLLDNSSRSISDYRRKEKSPLIISVEGKNIDAIQCLLSDKHFDVNEMNFQCNTGKETALHIACRLDYREIVNQLLTKGPNLQLRDANGKCPIHSAAWNGNTETVRLLLEHDKKQAEYLLDYSDNLRGLALYHIAVFKRNDALINLLMELNLPIDSIDGKQQTPLAFALQGDRWNIVETLIDLSIDQKAHSMSDNRGQTALHIAVEKLPALKSDVDRNVCNVVIEKLCKRGVNKISNKDGKSPLQVVQTKRKRLEEDIKLLDGLVERLQKHD